MIAKKNVSRLLKIRTSIKAGARCASCGLG